MAYRIPLIAVIFTFPVVALIITLPYILHQYHKYGSVNPLRTLIIYSFILYMMAIYFLVILPLPKLNEVTKPEVYMRLVPFSFIGDFLRESSLKLGDPSTYLKAIKEPCFYVVFFNILMTIPFGIYLRYYFKKDFKSTAISTFLLSLFFELTQLSGLYFIYKYPYRLFDIDDLLLNTLGGIIGYALAGIVSKLLPTRDEIDEHSKRAGTHVSGLRRMMVFFLDSLIFTVLFRLSKI
ncbi:MAG TPA: VanZ family protein, partial [Firmicutes bacterium]|nr:VanZ family protein [Bacillota bacterium]